MKNKKGVAEHVDWIISIGIFLTYLLGIFILIKPGVIPVHDYDTLLDIMEENVKKDFNYVSDPFDFDGLYWTLYKVPLFITEMPAIIQPGKDEGCIKINFPYEGVSEDKINIYKITKNPTTQEEIFFPLNRKLEGSSLYIEGEGGGSWNPQNEYKLYFSTNKAYSKENIENEGNTIGVSGDFIGDGGLCINDNDGLKYSLGISEKTKGISELALNSLKSILENILENKYEDIKGVYGYPKSKEFSVVITNKDNSINYEYKVKEPDPKTNVYTRQWSDFILNYDGKRDPIQVSIKVW